MQFRAILWVRLLLGVCLIGAKARAEPEWLWREGGSVVDLTRAFELGALPDRARLKATSDFAEIEVWLNDRHLVTLEAYDDVVEIPLVPSLFWIGENALRVNAKGRPGPSAFALSLDLGGETIQTDASWQATSYGPIGRERFRVGHLAELGATSDYNQWKEAPQGDHGEAAFSVLPKGATIERLRVAEPEEDSWVSLTFDPKGRLLIARETRGLLRFNLNEGAVDEVEVVNDTLEECRGLLWAHDSLYANANDSKALYRLRDTTNDDQFDEVTKLVATAGAVGHGRNDLALDDEGRIYAIHGDSVELPDAAQSLTRAEPGNPAELGFLLQMNAEGGDRKILTRGMRNPYGIAFNPEGEAFTYDADHERDLGLPLYRPTQITHLVEGANYGWWQSEKSETSWPTWAPDGWPAAVYLGRGSPTSVAFRGSDLYALDWAYGRIIKVTLTPRGASYHGSAETWLRGRPLNVTDLEFRGDSLFFITGGRKTQSALYRLTLPPLEVDAGTVQSERRADFSAQQRALRDRLARLEATNEEVWASLGSHDPFLRNAARRLVETRPALIEIFRERAPESLAALTLRLAEARIEPESPGLRSALKKHIPSSGRTAQLTWARAVEWIGGVEGLIFPEPASVEVAREFVSLRVAAGDPAVIPEALAQMAAATNQRHRFHFLEQLSLVTLGWNEAAQRTFAIALLDAKRLANGDRNLPEFLARVEAAALENFPNPEIVTRVLAEDAPSTVIEIEPRPFVKHWSLQDFVDDRLPESSGQPAEGRKLFTAARCVLCHQHGTLGYPIGPNLTAVSNRFSRMDLLRSILEPSHVIAEGYETHRITRIDGTEVIGRIVRDDLRESMLYLATNPYANTSDVRLPKSEVASFEPLAISPMPAGLLSTLERGEIEELLEFLGQDESLSGLPSPSVAR